MATQSQFTLKARRRGYHVITREVMENLPDLPNGGF